MSELSSLDLELNLLLSVYYFGKLLVLNISTRTLRPLWEWRYQVYIVFLTVALF